MMDKGHTITIRVPLTLKKRGGRKLIITPGGREAKGKAETPGDPSLVKALARAFRWRGMLETGAFATIQELAAAEKINPSYVSRMLRLTLLAPEMIEAMLDGPVTVLCRSFDHLLCSKGDEPWVQAGRMNFAKKRCE
jgi:hypothetical protein